ncbi:MAG TPA: nucleotidyltransferase domain-containing protein [Candidatus Dormibacteraeota bacterium]
MRAHHQRVVQRLVDQFQDDPRFPAMIVGGSVARGWASDDSDVDVMLVATDEEFQRRLATGELGYVSTEPADYPGGYVDGKIVDVAFLREVADRGSEPARAAFLDAIVGYSRVPDLDALLARIPVYPEHERDAKMRAFASHLALLHWYVGEADKRQDPYLLSWTATNLVLYGGRLVLAHNRLLFPFHKWFMRQLRLAPDRPANMVELAEAVLRRPSRETALRFFECVSSFRDWGVPLSRAGVDFMLETEWIWRGGRPPLAER